MKQIRYRFYRVRLITRQADEAALTVAFDTDVPLGAFQRATYWKPLLIRLHPETPVEHAVRSDTTHWQTSGWDAVGYQSAA
ncbi:hypothetical protein PQR37_03740 [Paraburkholderia nemoris]|uniref:hypothetical protein n=1 Tax=Paraburkholderia nemoris TaxID=2793076 RepID=UPI001EEFA1B8|nr:MULTISPECIES: hypothetical protein [Paraburkholderia]